MRNITRLATCGIAVVALLATAQVSYGQLVAFKAKGRNSSYDGLNYGGPGNATHMGRANFSGQATADFPAESLPEFGVPYNVTFGETLVAENKKGDKIFFSGEGTVTLVDLGDGLGGPISAIWEAEFTVIDGEGKFANVSGGPEPIKVTAINDPFVLGTFPIFYSWTLSGKINLGKNKNK